MKKWQIALVVVVIIAVGVGAFFGGRATGGGNAATTASTGQVAGQGNGTRPNGMQGPGGTGDFAGPGGNGRNMISGSILAADASSITIQTSDGSTKLVLLSGSTTISKTADGSVSDLVTGKDVMVIGTTNTDGTVTATGIQLGVSLLQGSQGGPPTGGGSSTTTTSAQ